jgi:hypothetical protein
MDEVLEDLCKAGELCEKNAHKTEPTKQKRARSEVERSVRIPPAEFIQCCSTKGCLYSCKPTISEKTTDVTCRPSPGAQRHFALFPFVLHPAIHGRIQQSVRHKPKPQSCSRIARRARGRSSSASLPKQKHEAIEMGYRENERRQADSQLPGCRTVLC